MYIIKNNKKIPIKIDDDSVVEGFSWKNDWPFVVGISLAVIFVILLIIFLAMNHGQDKKQYYGKSTGSSKSSRSARRSF